MLFFGLGFALHTGLAQVIPHEIVAAGWRERGVGLAVLQGHAEGAITLLLDAFDVAVLGFLHHRRVRQLGAATAAAGHLHENHHQDDADDEPDANIFYPIVHACSFNFASLILRNGSFKCMLILRRLLYTKRITLLFGFRHICFISLNHAVASIRAPSGKFRDSHRAMPRVFLRQRF